jgi:hypothetical protein
MRRRINELFEHSMRLEKRIAEVTLETADSAGQN